MSENLKVERLHTCTFGIIVGVSTHICVLLAWPTKSYDRGIMWYRMSDLDDIRWKECRLRPG